ncbi:MAG: MltA domain-containing protein, partial [Acidiferrobacterales bacterium]|nr:MltA domain-containing protein [Acidiferrobacterales bacterium]
MQKPEPGIGKPMKWDQLQGWEEDQHELAWPALLQSCGRLDSKSLWDKICSAAIAEKNPTTENARLFFETWFAPHPVYAES